MVEVDELLDIELHSDNGKAIFEVDRDEIGIGMLMFVCLPDDGLECIFVLKKLVCEFCIILSFFGKRVFRQVRAP